MKYVLGCGAVLLALAAALPGMVEQACSDAGDGWSGACPECVSHAEAWDSLPPTMD